MKQCYLLFSIVTLLFLTGCLYPESNLSRNKIPNTVQLEGIQKAVDTYRERNQGLVPIQNRESDTAIFQKYPLDFSKLKETNLIAETPGNAFERGGVYQYVLINPETNPLVRLIDLRITNKLRELQLKINFYRSEHQYPPYGERIEGNVFSINYKLLGLKEPPYIVSPYSQNNLPIVIDADGNLYVDYRLDLYQALNSFDNSYSYGDDVRYILANNYPFVPAYSLPYTIKDGEPIFYLKNE